MAISDGGQVAPRTEGEKIYGYCRFITPPRYQRNSDLFEA